MALALLLASGLALAEDCDLEPLQVIGSVPNNEATQVPVDARIIGILGDGLWDEVQWSLTMDWDNGSYPGTSESWCHPDGGPERLRCFVAFTPSEPFPPNTEFNVLLDADEDWEGSGNGREVFYVKTGSTDAIAAEGQPAVNVLSARDQDTACGWEGSRVWELTLTPSSSDFYGLSLLHVYSVDSDNGNHHVATRSVPAAGGLVSVTVARDQADPWTDCFIVIQEDARGERSLTSEMTCWDPPPDTGDDTDDSALDAGGCGCASLSPRPGWAWCLPALVCWSSRRRRTTR